MSHKLMIFLKCYGNVSKQTNPLQLDDSITHKCLAIFKAIRRILDMQDQNFCSCKYENFLKT